MDLNNNSFNISNYFDCSLVTNETNLLNLKPISEYTDEKVDTLPSFIHPDEDEHDVVIMSNTVPQETVRQTNENHEQDIDPVVVPPANRLNLQVCKAPEDWSELSTFGIDLNGEVVLPTKIQSRLYTTGYGDFVIPTKKDARLSKILKTLKIRKSLKKNQESLIIRNRKVKRRPMY